MNKQTSFIFAAIHNNEIVCFDTNLKGFHKQLDNKYQGAKNYQWYYRQFLAENRFYSTIDGKDFWFQKLGEGGK